MLPAQLDTSEQMLRKAVGASEDIIWQSLRLRAEGRKALLVFIEGMVDRQSLQEFVVAPLATEDSSEGLPPKLMDMAKRLIHTAIKQEAKDAAKARDALFRGLALLLVDGYAGALILGVQDWEERPVQSPPSEAGLRGPRDGFVENIVTNINLVRRRIKDPNLVVKYWPVGARTRTRVAVLHMADITRKRLIEEIHSRVAATEFDGILDASQLRELLTGVLWTPFPKMATTERPDSVCAALLGGKVVVLVDNSPFALVAPTTLMETLWAPDDYYTNPIVTGMMRLVRTFGVLVTVLLPPLYIGITMYAPALVRTDLAIYLARERAGIPLTPALEIIFLETMMEILHEATIRLPAKVGSAATVVGGLIIGQAAVEARLISGMAVIVVAIAAIGSFTVPVQEMGQVWRVTKWAFIAAATVMGVYGVFAAAFIMFSWVASQDSFGTPYMIPLAPLVWGDLKRDSLSRLSWSLVRKRPATNRTKDSDRTSQPQNRKYQDGGER